MIKDKSNEADKIDNKDMGIFTDKKWKNRWNIQELDDFMGVNN